MATLQYVTQFDTRIREMYGHELISNDLFLSNQDIQIRGAKEIKLPKLTVSGYKDHTRTLGFNSGDYSNTFEVKQLDHDRDIEFAIDPMDVDETNQIVSIANIQKRFEVTQAIPELDCYTFSKVFSELKRVKADAIKEVEITTANVLSDFDDNCEAFENAGVPLSRCILYCTPAYKKTLKNADGISRMMNVAGDGTLNRAVHSMDDLGKIVTVPVDRFKTKYDFSNGFKAHSTGKQIHYILIDPEAQVSRVKYSYINVYTPGHDSRVADNYLYQNRRYNGTFAIDDMLKDGCIIAAETGAKS